MPYNTAIRKARGKENEMTEFSNKVIKLDNQTIIDAIAATWNSPEGEIFREIGFEILEQRNGEEYSDKVYAELWNRFN